MQLRASEIAIHTEHNTDDILDLIAQNLRLIQEVKGQTDLLDEIHRHVAALSQRSGRTHAPPPEPTDPSIGSPP